MQNNHLPFFGVKNFKSFKGEHFFNLKNITFLIGKNSSGKSSLIQALRIASNSPEQDSYDIDLGLKESWLNKYSLGDNVEFTSPINLGIEYFRNKLFYCQSYYPTPINLDYRGYFFHKFLSTENDLQHIFAKTEEELAFEEFEGTSDNLDFFNVINRDTLKRYDYKTFELEYNFLKTQYKNRNQAISNLLNYRIQTSEERTRWINERDRLVELCKHRKEELETRYPSDPSKIYDPYPSGIFDIYYEEFYLIEIINFVLKSSDNELENIELTDFYLHIDFKKSDKLKFNFFNLKSNIINLNLNELKSLINEIIKYDKYLTLEILTKSEFYFLPQKFPLYKIIKDRGINSNDSAALNWKQNIKYLSKKNHEQIDYVKESEITQERLEFVSKYLKIFGIGDKIDFKKISVKGNIVIEPVIVKLGEIKDLYSYHGYGIQVLIPMLLSIMSDDNLIILIEEPESNLHPALQSKLADFFAEASIIFQKQFIIETHSEYIIRRMQYLVANHYTKSKKDIPTIDAENINIYYFNDPIVQLENNKEYSFEIKIDKRGMLDKDFGEGFFDVSSNLAIDLLRISSYN